MIQKSITEYVLEFVDNYLPLWFNNEENKGPLFIYISGPQGIGKSYVSELLCSHLQEKYRDEGKNIVRMSIDDFYLTHKDQEALNDQFDDNDLLQGRGLPGTHDMKLLGDCLRAILHGENPMATGASETQYVSLPQYDKSKFGGAGDRSSEFVKVKLPIDVVILDGWFLGFHPILRGVELDESQLKGDIVDVNGHLFMYSDLIWDNPEIKSLGIVLTTDDIKNVYTWRRDQEHELIKEKGSGMTDEEVEKFLDRYMPCYDLYYDTFMHSESFGSIATLTLGIDINRHVYSVRQRSIE